MFVDNQLSFKKCRINLNFIQIRKLMADQDKISSLLTNAVYYIVGPNLKQKSTVRTTDVKPALDLLHAVSKLPFATKTWKKEVWEAFSDAKFFCMSSGHLNAWKSIFQSLMIVDKETKTAELVSRISALPASSLFLSKEQEALSRSYSLRRLSFAIWCGATDQYVAQL